jgi:hypothetical protein
MNWSALESIGEIVSALTVVISLVYLAMQIRVNYKMVQVESLRTVLDGAHDRIFLPSYNHQEIAEFESLTSSNTEEVIPEKSISVLIGSKPRIE